MPRETDLDRDDSDELPGDDDSRDKSASGSSGAAAVDYKSKYQGASRTIDRLQKDLLKAQKARDEALDAAEGDLSTLRLKVSDLTKQIKEKDEALTTASSGKGDIEGKYNRLKAKDDASKAVAEKYSVLLADHMMGDLKLPTDFDSPEDYEKYLQRQAAKYGIEPDEDEPGEEEVDQKEDTKKPNPKPPLKQRMRGATPSSGYRTTERKGGKSGRTGEDIADEMASLDPRSSNYGEKYESLFQELNEYTESNAV